MDTIKPVDAFYDLPDPNQGKQMPPIYGNNGIFDNVAALNVGQGANGLYLDKDGLRIGNSQTAQAPFSVDMEGNIVANDAQMNNTIMNSATFKDATGTTIIDAQGLVSSTNFSALIAGKQDFTSDQFNSPSLTDITDTLLSFPLNRPRQAIFNLTGEFRFVSTATGNIGMYCFIHTSSNAAGDGIGGILEPRITLAGDQHKSPSENGQYVTLSTSVLYPLALPSYPGTYTIKAQIQTINNTDGARVRVRTLSVIFLGV